MGIEALLSTQIIDTTTVGRAVMTAVDAAAARTALGLGTLATQNGTITDYLTTAAAATTYQPLDGDLTALAALSGTNNIYYRSAADTWSSVTIGSGLTFTGGTLAASGGSGISSLNGLTDATQTFAAGTTGTDVAWVSSAGVHTLNIPSASATARGLVTTGAQTFTGSKTLLSAGTTDTPLKVQVVANQTGNAQQWLGSTGTVEGYVSVYTDSIKGTLKTLLAVDRLFLMDGNENAYSSGGIDAGGGLQLWWSGNGETLNISGQGAQQIASFVSSGTGSVFNTSIGFAAAGIASNTVDLLLARDAADILNQRRGTNPQTRRLTNTYASTTSYEWLSIGWSSNVCTITTEKGSAGGTLRGLRIGDSATALLGFYGATAIVQPGTGVASATRVGGGGTALTDTDTFDGYTIGQVVKALRNLGFLA